jgi:hypothetical protein
MGLQADARAAVVAFLTDYAADDPAPGTPNSRMQVYPGRPASLNPPTGFVDAIRSNIEYSGPTLIQQTVTVEAIVLHGLFDSKEAADNKDAFVDGLIEWQRIRYHQSGANTTIGLVGTEDLPNYVPDWMPPERQRTYYATRLDFEVYAGG